MVERFKPSTYEHFKIPKMDRSKDGEYVRHSDYAELEADNARLSADRDFWKERFQVETRSRIEAEASLSRTGAVKVKAAEIVEDAIRRCRELHDYAGRPAWEKAMEDAILSALEPAARDTSPVVSHETGNVEDKAAAPEGEHEAEPEELRKWREDQIERVRDGSFLTHPAEQVVTDEMVRDAAEVIYACRHIYSDKDLAKAVLTAALAQKEAGQ